MSGRQGATALAGMLHGYGVTHVFMVPAVLRRTSPSSSACTRRSRRSPRTSR
jgi:hypothetical protein